MRTLATALVSADHLSTGGGPDRLSTSVQRETRKARRQFVFPATLNKAADDLAKELNSSLNETVLVAMAYLILHRPEEAIALIKKGKESKMQRLRTPRRREARTADAQLALEPDSFASDSDSTTSATETDTDQT